MFDPSEYQLLDFGDNEKLENIGGIVVRRQTPSAIGKRQRCELWETAQIRFVRSGDSSGWIGEGHERWQVQFQGRKFSLRQTPTGQVGVFPEQAENWDWISGLQGDLSGMQALNLFGYTGGTTMALANRGANVVHVDAAKSVVNWARLNASQSGLESASIRWIVEDVMTFVQREINRGNRYHIVVADPPSFGRGPNGETWKIQRDFPELIKKLVQLTDGCCKMLLMTCHTIGFEHEKLKILVSDAFGRKRNSSESFQMSLVASSGMHLPSGTCVRWFLP